MTGILELHNTILTFLLRAVLPTHFSLFHLSLRSLPRALLHHSNAVEISHIDLLFDLSVMADISLEAYACVCV